MKHLVLQTDSFRQLETDFGQWLRVLGYAQSSVKEMPIHLRELFYYLEQGEVYLVEAIEKAHLQGFFTYLHQRVNQRSGGSLSPAYLAKYWQAVKNLDRYLRETQQWGLTLPVSGIQSERNLRPMVSQSEIQALYAACTDTPVGQRDRAMLSLFYGCGLRKSEGIGLNVDDILLERGLVYVRHGKNYQERYVPMSPAVIQHLQSYLREGRLLLLGQAGSDALLLSLRGKRVSEGLLPYRLRVLCEQTGDRALIERQVSLHGLRHSIATHLLQQGMKLGQIARFLGHASLESTQIYTHVSNEYL
jgi:integrase/recombinase XerD